MNNFNFRLQKVLNYKKTVEDHKKGKYGIIQEKLINEENKLSNFNSYKDSLIEKKKSNQNKIKAGNLAMYSNYINDLNKRIEMQEEIVMETKNAVEEAKYEMIESMKEKKIYEKLKENQYEKHLYDLKKDEEKIIDSIVSFKTSTH